MTRTYKIEIILTSNETKPYWVIEAIEEQLERGEDLIEYIIEEQT